MLGTVEGLERCLSGKEHLLLLQRSRILFQTPALAGSSQLLEILALGCPFLVYTDTCIHVCTDTCAHTKHTHTHISKYIKEYALPDTNREQWPWFVFSLSCVCVWGGEPPSIQSIKNNIEMIFKEMPFAKVIQRLVGDSYIAGVGYQSSSKWKT